MLLRRRMPEWDGYARKPMCTLSVWGKPRENWLTTKTKEGPTEIWTRIAGFKVQSANHYTMGPLHALWSKQLGMWLQCVTCTLFWWFLSCMNEGLIISAPQCEKRRAHFASSYSQSPRRVWVPAFLAKSKLHLLNFWPGPWMSIYGVYT